MAGGIAGALGLGVEEYPADWKQHGRGAGMIRNYQMLDTKPDLVIAFWDGKSSGTRHTFTEARRRGITVEVIIENRSISGALYRFTATGDAFGN